MADINYYGKLFDSPEITPAIARAANIAKTFGKGLIEAKTPVDTGKLKGSWKVGLEAQGLRIKNDTFYAGFVEFGTSKMSPRAMMTSSLPEIQGVFIEELYKEIGEELAGEMLADFARPGYGTAVNPDGRGRYPEVGKNIEPVSKTGLSKRNKKTSKEYLFANPAKILRPAQESRIAKARPLLQRKQR